MKNNQFKSIIFFLLFAFIHVTASAQEFLSWEKLNLIFKQENINTKALSHVECFFKNYENSIFKKRVSLDSENSNRCGGDPSITIDSKRIFAIIDYTSNSDEQRMFLVDRVTGKISKMAVAHGRFQANMTNFKLAPNKNSILQARYYSNELNSNAPSSGYFVAGNEYEGKFGQSLTMHGLESEVNDQACERAVVIHKHLMVTKKQAFILSSGCPMVSKDNISHVVSLLKASEGKNGGLVFIYGEREKNWSHDTCSGSFNF